MKKYFITGTNTEVGKTIFAGMLARHFREQGLDVAYVKPVQTGYPEDDDAAVVRELSGLHPEQTATLATHPEPVAPAFVFDPFPFQETVQAINGIEGVDVLLVESAGGLLVPLDGKRCNADLIRPCGLSVIVVVPNRLGCLNDALLNNYFLGSLKMPLHGLAVNNHYVVNSDFGDKNRAWLEKLLPGAVRYVFDDRELQVLSS